MKSTKLILGLALALGAGWAAAAVEVRFIEPEKFSDVRDANFRQRDGTLKEIREHLQKLGDKQLPGKDLLIEVTDVDLAGQVEPVGRRMEMLRVMRETGRPAMEFRYVLSEGGKEVSHGDVHLRDIAYLQQFNRYSDGDTLRYEKRMMDEWFRSEFGLPKSTVSKADN